jgi:hypothetical protein
MTWDDAVVAALALPGTELSTHYGQPAVKANGNVFLNVGHEPATSFVLHLDRDTIELMLEVCSETFWQTPHYAGHPAVLVRYQGPHEDVVREMIARAAERARTKPMPKQRRA